MTDLRLPALAAAAWAGGVLGMVRPGWVPGAVAALLGVWVVLAVGLRRRRTAVPQVVTAGAAILLLATVAWSAMVRGETVQGGPVAELARDGVSAELTLTVTSDPRPSRSGEVTVVRGVVDRVRGRGSTWSTRAPVVLLTDEAWLEVPLGARVRTHGVLVPAEGHTSALVRVHAPPSVVAGPRVWWRGAETVREGIRTAVAHRPPDQRILVPSLVVGDDAGLEETLVRDFATTGLTHLTAVSGTNLTLLVGAMLVAARWLGVRGRGMYLVAVAGIVGFVLLARTEPSVVRAATMGSVALLGLGTNGRQRGVRSLGAAVVLLLLWDPAMAVQVGFALSVLATGGILLLAPDWRDAMAGWLPRRAAEALAIPAAAQLACTPVVAAISGEVSLAAVLANLLVAPAVAPATVLGLAGGLCAVVWPALGQLVATPAAWSVGWVIAVARWGASLPTPSVEWGTGPAPIAALVLLAVVLALVAPRLLAGRWLGTVVLVVLVLGAFVTVPSPGWPPRDWLVVACDVGQGDALVLRAGPAQAVVVDAGPEPRAVDECLDDLGVRAVPLLVLTHFHADHVDGLPGVLAGRRVGEVDVSPVPVPAEGAAQTLATLAEVGLAPTVGGHLETRVVGDVVLQQLWPPSDRAVDAGEDSANDASVVLLAQVGDLRVLLTGDIEPPAQRGVHRVMAGTRVDVLKVPHHGSRYQDLEFLRSLGATVAVVSAGEDNGYGHPDPGLVDALEGGGASVWRTDEHGDVSLVWREGAPGVVPRR